MPHLFAARFMQNAVITAHIIFFAVHESVATPQTLLDAIFFSLLIAFLGQFLIIILHTVTQHDFSPHPWIAMLCGHVALTVGGTLNLLALRNTTHDPSYNVSYGDPAYFFVLGGLFLLSCTGLAIATKRSYIEKFYACPSRLTLNEVLGYALSSLFLMLVSTSFLALIAFDLERYLQDVVTMLCVLFGIIPLAYNIMSVKKAA